MKHPIHDLPAFKRWFGKSKVVDELKRPLVVYKGMYPYDWTKETATDPGPAIATIKRDTEFPAFNGNEPGLKIAGFFGGKETASRFAEAMNGSVFPTYLSLQRPYVVDARGRKAGHVQFGPSGKPFRDALRSGRYDGAIIKNTDDEGTIYVAMRPEQIKSALSNEGTFDPLNPDITKAGGGFVELQKASGGSVNHAPTEAQKAAGNYAKKHISFQGIPITIENEMGSVRSGRDRNGKAWSCKLPADYGYVKRTEGADGDHVDVYVGPDKHSNLVVIVDQQHLDSRQFDEHKCLLGFVSEQQALRCYRDGFSDGKGNDRIGHVKSMSVDAFKQWLKNGKTTKPAARQDIVAQALNLVGRQAHVRT